MYTLAHYINKAEAINPQLWITRTYSEGAAHCFMGHCGERNGQVRPAEAEWIYDLFTKYGLNPIDVNDGIDESGNRFSYPTPDKRIIAALYWIRGQMAVEQAQEIVNKVGVVV